MTTPESCSLAEEWSNGVQTVRIRWSRSNPAPHDMANILFVTATDTGVGKTVLTSLLLLHLRRAGVDVLGIKPFCSGGWADVDRLRRMQSPRPSREQVTPFFFKQPLAPSVAMRMNGGSKVTLKEAVAVVRERARGRECLVVEGVGGVRVPLGENRGNRNFCVADWIAALPCPCKVILVAANRLGTVNHTLLSLEALRARGVNRVQVVLMEVEKADPSATTNGDLIKKVMREEKWKGEVKTVGFLGKMGKSTEWDEAVLANGSRIFEKVLAGIWLPDTFCPRQRDTAVKREPGPRRR